MLIKQGLNKADGRRTGADPRARGRSADQLAGSARPRARGFGASEPNAVSAGGSRADAANDDLQLVGVASFV